MKKNRNRAFLSAFRKTGSCRLVFWYYKVTEQAEINTAIESAFEHDTEVIVEEAIGGVEVGCAILGIDNLTVGRIDEIELSNGFFDYTEKYTLKTSKSICLQDFLQKKKKRVQETAVAIYKAFWAVPALRGRYVLYTFQ